MKILTQNKRKLIDMDQLREIELTENRGDNEEINIVKSINLKGSTFNYGVYLGTYKTMEKAQEVLREIMEKYEHSELLKCNGAYRDSINFNFIYEMPLEE